MDLSLALYVECVKMVQIEVKDKSIHYQRKYKIYLKI